MKTLFVALSLILSASTGFANEYQSAIRGLDCPELFRELELQEKRIELLTKRGAVEKLVEAGEQRQAVRDQLADTCPNY